MHGRDGYATMLSCTGCPSTRQGRNDREMIQYTPPICHNFRRWLFSAWLCVGLISSVSQCQAEDLVIKPVILQAIGQSEIPALQEGPVRQVLVKEGDVVNIDQGLIQIDDQLALFRKNKADIEQKIAAKQAGNKSELNLAETEIKVAQANLQRAMISRQKFPDTPSQAEVDELELRVAQARQHREKADHELQLATLAHELAAQNLVSADIELQRHLIKSPIQGTVVEMHAQPGDWVRSGQMLARVVRTDRLKAEGRLPFRPDQPSLLGAEVVFRGDGITETQRGKIVFVSPEVDSNDSSQRIVAEIDNTRGRLNPGLRGQLTVRSQ